MLFLLKKIVGDLLMPLGFSLGLLVIGMVLMWLGRWRWLAKFLVTAGCVLLLIFSNRFVGYQLAHGLEARYAPLRMQSLVAAGTLARVELPSSAKNNDDRARADSSRRPIIVVLSGGASDDAQLPELDRLSPNSALRVSAAVQIYRKLIASSSVPKVQGQNAKGAAGLRMLPRMILSGGPTLNSEPEAIPMEKLAESLGVPAGDIVLETRSKDTFSEAKYLQPAVKKQPFLLVTSAIQMPRAMALFEHMGMHPIAAPTDFAAQRTTESLALKLLPSVTALHESTIAMHEQIGMLWEHLRGQL